MLNLISAEEGKQLTKRQLRNYEHISQLGEPAEQGALPGLDQTFSSIALASQNTIKYNLVQPKYSKIQPNSTSTDFDNVDYKGLSISRLDCITEDNLCKDNSLSVFSFLQCKNKIIN